MPYLGLTGSHCVSMIMPLTGIRTFGLLCDDNKQYTNSPLLNILCFFKTNKILQF